MSACRREGGLFFENGGVAVEHVFSLLSSGGSAAGKASEASEAAYGLLMSFYGSQSAEPGAGKRLPLVVEAALGIIRRDYAFLDGIGELAERLEVSQEYLTRCFCRFIGMTPGKYLNRVRIENARLLLRQGGHSIQFVSEACGFTNANYFARVFRAAVGMSEASDALIVVVSEETGSISVAQGGTLRRRLTSGELLEILTEFLITDDEKSPKLHRRKHHDKDE